jgi:hypothetical protein
MQNGTSASRRLDRRIGDCDARGEARSPSFAADRVPCHRLCLQGMTRRHVYSVVALALLALTGLALFLPARTPTLHFVDPDRVAELELEMWQAYYAKQKPRLFSLLVTTLREQYGYSRFAATKSAFYLARGAARFADMHGDYEARVLPDLEHGYALLQRWTGAPFDPVAVARSELAWWVARRNPAQNSAENVGRLIGEEYVALYGAACDREGAADAGLLRARAGKLRDSGGAHADWPKVGALLHQSYRALARALR